MNLLYYTPLAGCDRELGPRRVDCLSRPFFQVQAGLDTIIVLHVRRTVLTCSDVRTRMKGRNNVSKPAPKKNSSSL